MRYNIYKANSIPTEDNVKATVSSLEYSGTWMEDCSITATVKSPVPIDFVSGDYIIYRGEYFYIDLEPNVKKQARSMMYGEAFVYDSLVFRSAIRELKMCDFLDYLVTDKDDSIHFSASSSVTFFASTVRDLAVRIQANLSRLYPELDMDGNIQWDTNSVPSMPKSKWTVIVDDSIQTSYDEDDYEGDGKPRHDGTFDADGNQIVRDVVCTLANVKVYDALELVKSQFKTTYTIKGRTITIGGKASVRGDEPFEYYDENTGKRKGLVTIEKNVNDQYEVVTRLRAYGSSRNLPTRYYVNKDVTLGVFNVPYIRRVPVENASAPGADYYGYIDFSATTQNGCVTEITDFQRSGDTNTYRYRKDNYFIKTNQVLAFGQTVADFVLDDTAYAARYGKWSTNSVAGQMFEGEDGVTVNLTVGRGDKEAYFEDVKVRIGWYKKGEIEDEVERDHHTGEITYIGPATMIIDEKFYLAIYFMDKEGSPCDGRWSSIKEAIDSYVSTEDGNIKVVFSQGCNAGYFPEAMKNYDDASLKTYDIFNLMLPGFPQVSLRDYVYGDGDTIKPNEDLLEWIEKCYGNREILQGRLSEDPHFPYIDSPMAEVYGIRESSVYFDGSNEDFDEIYPTYEGMRWQGVRVDEIASVDTTKFNDNGVYADEQLDAVELTIPYAGFDFAKVMQQSDNISIAMKNGMCAGREFNVSRALMQTSTEGAKSVKLYVERPYDETIKRYFPYEDYPISAGDRFVVLNMPLPASYVEAASLSVFKQAVLYLSQHDKPSYTYTPSLSKEYIRREYDAVGEENSVYYNIKEGDNIHFKDEDLGIDETLHIKSLTIKENSDYLPVVEITIQEKEPETKLSSLQKQINNLTNSGATNLGGSSDKTATQKKLSMKLDYTWLGRIFKAYDAEGAEVSPNSDAEIKYIKFLVEVKD